MSKKSSRKKYNLKKYAGLTAVILSIMMAVLSCVVLVPEKSIFAKDKFISNYEKALLELFNKKENIDMSNEEYLNLLTTIYFKLYSNCI